MPKEKRRKMPKMIPKVKYQEWYPKPKIKLLKNIFHTDSFKKSGQQVFSNANLKNLRLFVI